MKISGTTIIKNGVKLGFPFIQSIKSILPICDEFVVAVGDCEDDTRARILAIGDPKIRIIDTVWNTSNRQGGLVLSEQTNEALSNCKNEYVFYLQSDEAVNEIDYKIIIDGLDFISKLDDVDALAFKYYHFYGNYSTIQSGRNWYKAEARVIKNHRGILSFGDAQGFRRNGKKIKAKLSDAYIYHYGWARPPEVMMEKIRSFHSLWHDDNWIKDKCSSTTLIDYFADLGNLVSFKGKHPDVMIDYIRSQNNLEFIGELRKEYLKKRGLGQMLKDFSRKLPFGEHYNFIKA